LFGAECPKVAESVSTDCRAGTSVSAAKATFREFT
jgi:hypothetical protein